MPTTLGLADPRERELLVFTLWEDAASPAGPTPSLLEACRVSHAAEWYGTHPELLDQWPEMVLQEEYTLSYVEDTWKALKRAREAACR